MVACGVGGWLYCDTTGRKFVSPLSTFQLAVTLWIRVPQRVSRLQFYYRHGPFQLAALITVHVFLLNVLINLIHMYFFIKFVK